MQFLKRTGLALAVLLTGAAAIPVGAATASNPSPGVLAGRAIYDYYCYQCHGYRGDARTTASQYLRPRPRDFTRTAREQLSREAMLEAVRHGRAGTGMVSFSRVLDEDQMNAVVDYVRERLMARKPLTERYHSGANDWPDHDRFAAAFPFVDGSLSPYAAWDRLTPEQRAGQRLFMSACISCHEAGTDPGDPIWETRIVSYPPMQYVHEANAQAQAPVAPSIHPNHETPTPATGLNTEQLHGRRLYLDNCAHCHAPDGSGRNWVGGFLEPHARDFRAGEAITADNREALRTLISAGVAGTAMPAWREVLSTGEIGAIISYLQRQFSRATSAEPDTPSAQTRIRPPPPVWRASRTRP